MGLMHKARWVLLAFLAACDCSSPPGDPCETSADCPTGQSCVDQVCISTVGDLGTGDMRSGECTAERACRSGATCCAEGEECVDSLYCFPVCAEERCGDNGSVCCGAGQVCLDGVVCAASCGAEETLCGASNELCCGAGDVCLDDSCVTPGEACGDDFDCLVDGQYCELVVGQCLDIPVRDPVCEVTPAFAEIDLEVEWHWAGLMADGRLYENVTTTPVVGDVSGDGIPDVVVTAYADTTQTNLVALDGATGEPHWNIGPGVDAADWISTSAIANFDTSDDALEVLYTLQSGGIRLVDGDGVTELARRTTGSAGASTRTIPTIADLDSDGIPDVVVGCHAMNGAALSDPARDFFDLGPCTLDVQDIVHSLVADLDGDGQPEITTGAVALKIDGTVLWGSVRGTHALSAIADLDVDGDPEVIVVEGGQIRVLDGATGAVHVGPGGDWLTSAPIPGGGNGGAPTVADFDADGLPEVSTAGRGAYAVYDPDCLPTPPRAGGDCAAGTTDFLRWQSATQDISSSVTGSSVFDFQGDGVAEVVYNDECFLHVYDGAQGTELLQAPRPNSSRTALEYPIVVDVDRDGNSEFVVPANRDRAVDRDNCPAAYAAALGVAIADLPPEIARGTAGVYAFGDPNDRWVRTRPIWNQYAYHVTNVTDRGVVPMTEPDNWTTPGLNNYRQNVQGAGVFNAPNLVVELEATARCASRQIRLSAVVTNIGSRGVAADVPIQLVRTVPGPEEVIFEGTTPTALLPGQSVRITATVDAVDYDTDYSFEARIDGADAAVECVEDDNTAIADERCPGLG